ncbi:hypothetical protein ACFL08_04430 [Patescibacteria group bacterium]
MKLFLLMLVVIMLVVLQSSESKAQGQPHYYHSDAELAAKVKKYHKAQAVRNAERQKQSMKERVQELIVKQHQEEREKEQLRKEGWNIKDFWPISIEKWEEQTGEKAGSHQQLHLVIEDDECVDKFAMRMIRLPEIIAIIEFKKTIRENAKATNEICSGLVIFQEKTSWPFTPITNPEASEFELLPQ